MLGFLAALDANNNREWFHENKAWYNEAKATFEALVTMLTTAIQSFDDAIPITPARELTFRLMRDTRFSHDKRPYNASFRAHIGRAGKKPIPCDYFVCLRPGDGSFVGGGLFASQFPGATQRIRDAIAENGEEIEHIIMRMDLPVQGEKLKRVPREYDATLPQSELLKHKSWYVEALIPDALVADPPRFIHEASWALQAIKPFNDFINRALEGFELPERR